MRIESIHSAGTDASALVRILSFCRAANAVTGTDAADAGSVPNTASTAGMQKASQYSSDRQWCLRCTSMSTGTLVVRELNLGG